MKILCNCPFTHFEVNNPNGDVTFCSNRHMVLGNVNKNSIEEIWNGEPYRKVRQKFLEGRIFEICTRNCPTLNGWKDLEKLNWYNELPKNSRAYYNAVLNEEEIKNGKIKLASKPRWLRFSTSYACNLKCYHCFQRMDRKLGLKLPDAFFEDVKNNIGYAQVVFFYGGEPFIEGRNLDLMEYLGRSKLPVKVFIISNGTILNEKVRSILEKLNFGFIDISIDSLSKDLYEELRYPAKWEEITEHLKFFSELMKRKKGDMLMTFTINKKNQDELIDFVKFSRELDAFPFFQFTHNVFNDSSFKKNYEIHSFKEHGNIRKRLLEARAFLRSTDLFMTSRNIDYLLSVASYRVLVPKRVKAFASGKSQGLKRLLTRMLKGSKR